MSKGKGIVTASKRISIVKSLTLLNLGIPSLLILSVVISMVSPGMAIFVDGIVFVLSWAWIGLIPCTTIAALLVGRGTDGIRRKTNLTLLCVWSISLIAMLLLH